ncbi:MAG: DUF2232 domain-containing protein [Alphaproteobacteria bacterium]|nr:DUF2232 domain-containing protein [Alphaproteobacteria bacterium]MBV8548135.1 DUF2232 domain-containing protein [Alphaproteobacteria bacterium]
MNAVSATQARWLTRVKHLVAAILAGAVSASLLVVALSHAETAIFFVAYIVSIPLYMAAMGIGALGGLIASFSGMASLLATQPLNIPFIYAFSYAVPATIVGALVMFTRKPRGETIPVVGLSEGHLLTAITVYPCLVFVTVVGLTMSHPGGLLALTTEAFHAITDQLGSHFSADQVTLLKSILDRLALVTPALAAYAWIIVNIMAVGLAQHALMNFKWNKRAPFRLQELQVPVPLIYAVALTGVIGSFAPAPFDYIDSNLSLILGLPFMFVGFAVVHAWAATKPRGVFFLIAFYALISLFVWLVLLVALLGVIDQWAHFRQRFTPTKPTTPTL